MDEKFEYKLGPFDCSEFNENKYTESIGEFITKIAAELAMDIDRARVKDILIKAKMYDLEFNPYTVDKNCKKKAIESYCKWLLYRIQDEKLTKKEIVYLLKNQIKKHQP